MLLVYAQSSIRDEEAMENTLATPNLSQAIRIKKMQEEENV